MQGTLNPTLRLFHLKHHGKVSTEKEGIKAVFQKSDGNPQLRLRSGLKDIHGEGLRQPGQGAESLHEGHDSKTGRGKTEVLENDYTRMRELETISPVRAVTQLLTRARAGTS